MLTLGKSFLIYNRMEGLETIYKKINAITPEEVRIIANEVLDFDQLSMLIYK
jgi:predicted Zn-dependent peptidase